MADSSLVELEESIQRVLARLQSAETENAGLRQEVERLRRSVEELEEDKRELGGRISQYRQDRSAIRAKLNRIQRWLAVLGESGAQSAAGSRLSEE